jgi:hypothetical protein
MCQKAKKCDEMCPACKKNLVRTTYDCHVKCPKVKAESEWGACGSQKSCNFLRIHATKECYSCEKLKERVNKWQANMEDGGDPNEEKDEADDYINSYQT